MSPYKLRELNAAKHREHLNSIGITPGAISGLKKYQQVHGNPPRKTEGSFWGRTGPGRKSSGAIQSMARGIKHG